MSMNDSPSEHLPLDDAEDEQLSDELIDKKQAAREAVNAASRALLNEDVELTDQHAEAIEDAGIALRALSNTLADRAETE